MRLSRLQRVLGLSLVLLIAFPAGLVSAASAGQSCKKVGALATSKSGGKTIKLVCTKVGKKLVWVVKGTKPAQPGTTTTTTVVVVKQPCVPGGVCVIGDIGPGGGTVFYDAGSLQPWGRYMEAAPNTWNGGSSDPKAEWGCYPTSLRAADTPLGAFGTAIGTGAANTATIVAGCPESGIAAKLADALTIGDKSDWFLPSKDELNELCKYARNQITGVTATGCGPSGPLRSGFAGAAYWSSSENGPLAWGAWFRDFGGGHNSGSKNFDFRVRPVRVF